MILIDNHAIQNFYQLHVYVLHNYGESNMLCERSLMCVYVQHYACVCTCVHTCVYIYISKRGLNGSCILYSRPLLMLLYLELRSAHIHT